MHRRRLVTGLLAVVLFVLSPGIASACSPIGYTSVRELPANQELLVGTIGEAVQGGRVFHVERAWNTEITKNPIVIDFNERLSQGGVRHGRQRGDAALRRALRRRRDARGQPGHAQDHPDTDHARELIAETVALYGPGVVPPPAAPDGVRVPVAVAGVVVLGALLVALRVLLRRFM